nr:exodeoxyribonuclease V subunit gamma [Parachlamydiaceae bacterium]
MKFAIGLIGGYNVLFRLMIRDTMIQQPHIYFSNRLEILYEELRDSLYAPGVLPFARRCVIVPSSAMGTWLQLRLAKDPKCGIAAGLEIGLIEESLGKLGRLLASQDPDQELPFYPREQELSLLIQATILETIEKYTLLTEEQQKLWRPLLEYLRAFPRYLPRKSEKRLIALCDNLAQLFAQYGRYGVRMLSEWEAKKGSSWQADLWRQFKVEHPSLQFPYQYLDIITAKINEKQILTPLGQLQIHLFGISFLAKTAHDFLINSSKFLSVNYYLLSPCQLFWSDICSDKESERLKKFWSKQSVSIDQQTALEEFLNSRNVLLGNFGRMGREMSLQIEQSIHQTTEFYVLPEQIQELPQYSQALTDESIFESSSGPLTLLQAIQADMTLLRTLEPENKITLSPIDDSVQLHIAPTKKREVEILYNVLVGVLNKHSKDKTPLTPGDIIVMVPDYMQYESAIAAVFGSKSSLLDFQLVEMRAAAKSSLVQGFMHLLSIASGRWEVKELLDLLDFPAFQRKQGFSFEDLRQIEKWIEKSGVYWGKTAAHRNEILRQAHRERTLVDE